MSRVQKILSQSYLFCDLLPNEIEHLECAGAVNVFPEFETILTEGMINDRLFTIIDGVVSVALNNAHLGVLTSGQHFGEMSWLDGRPAAASVIAAEDTTIFSIPHQEITTLVSGSALSGHKIMMAVARQLCERLRRTDMILRDANKRNVFDEKELEAILSELHANSIT